MTEGCFLHDSKCDAPSRRCIFHSIAEEIDKYLIKLQRICDHVLIDNLKGINKQLKLLRLHLWLNNVDQIVHQFRNIALLLLDLHLAALNPAHVKDIIDQAEQVVAGGKHLLQAVPHLVLIVNMAHRNGCKPNDSVHRRADIMRHI